MPVARYFLFVGGVLLALLFLIDAYVPSQVVVASHAAPSIDRNVVRIRSDQKLPERVVYDTSLPTIVPPAPKVQVAAPRPPVITDVMAQSVTAEQDVAAQARARNTFAQFVPAEAKKPEPQPQRKRRVAKHANPPMRLAQQSHYGLLGGQTWNSTW